mgnify:FL=1
MSCVVPLFAKEDANEKKEIFLEFVAGLRQKASENRKNIILGACLGLAYACFLMAICYDILVFQVIGSLFLFVVSVAVGFIFVFYFYYKRNVNKSDKLLFLFLIVVWLSLQILLIGGIEYQYQHALEDYKQDYIDAVDTGKYTALGASWLLTERYYSEMDKTYGQEGVLLPNRALFSSSTTLVFMGCNPLLLAYFVDPNSCNKLIFLQNKGNCGEFSGAIALMVRDVSGLETRQIQMEGVDHGLPEVYFEGDWWVFDKTYTTSSSPVKAQQYAAHLRDKFTDLYLSIADLRVANGDDSALEEHGFNASNVTISALFDTISDAKLDTPIANAEIEVYAVKYQRDPLVFKGKADDNGKCNLVLNGNKEYIILGNNGVYKGFTMVNIPPSKDESLKLLLY